MERSQGMQEYLSKLSATSETNYFLWKATERLKRHNTRLLRSRTGAREKEKAKTFATHLSKVFKLNPRLL